MLEIVPKRIAQEIESTLNQCGLLFRIFYRQKNHLSLKRKIEKNPGKYGHEKKIQDVVGIRVVLYFMDDIESAKNNLINRFVFDEESSTIDSPDSDKFNATRFNLVFKLPREHDIKSEYSEETSQVIDNTFEVQLRTVLSEGWHEVEHDLRYKCKDEWSSLERESRTLNGVYASLETSEWTLMKLFEDIAYKSYKSKNWIQMLKNKFRLRFNDNSLDDTIRSKLDHDSDFAKAIWRYERRKIIEALSMKHIPISFDNIIYIINIHTIKDREILNSTPAFITRELNSECKELVIS